MDRYYKPLPALVGSEARGPVLHVAYVIPN